LPRLGKTEQIVAVTNAMLTLRASAIVLHEAMRKSFIVTRTFGSTLFQQYLRIDQRRSREIIDEMRTSRLQLCTC
jgi:hypothetical protein